MGYELQTLMTCSDAFGHFIISQFLTHFIEEWSNWSNESVCPICTSAIHTYERRSSQHNLRQNHLTTRQKLFS